MPHRHFIIHKPFGVLSQFATQQVKQQRKRLLGELYDFPANTMAIGRLDEASEGLLLLTTDGQVSEFWRKPTIEKEYYAQVDGVPDAHAVEALARGVEIGFAGRRYTTKPCTVSAIEDPNFPERSRRIRDERHGPTSWLSVTLTEGKFRQVRKMTAAVGHPTLRLVRVRIGHHVLHDFQPGSVREVADLRE